MTARPTMSDVAAAAQVSVKTVSRVVNGETGVHPGTAAVVTAAINALGFRPNEVARSLRPGYSSQTLGLIIEDLGNPFYSQMARGVEEVAREHGFMVISGSSEEEPERERHLVQSLLRRRVNALLVVPARGDHTYLSRELADGTPAVFLDRPPQNYVADVVVLDNRGGARTATEHLLRQGHRRIGLISGFEEVYTGAERLAGYREALMDAGFPLDPALLRVNCHHPAEAALATEALVTLPDPPTALFTLNNRITIGALQALWTRKAATALVGFDDFELADLLPIPVSVVRHNPVELGRVAAKLVFARLAGDRQPPQTVTLPVQLEQRGSGEQRIH
jgi:LacI family transcriptional regulator